MKGMTKIARGTGKVFLALLGGIFMPVWIWVALGVAMNKKLREKEVRQAEVPTIGETLALNHVSTQHQNH
ncbi:MAG: hypothetical protein HW402_113 [Dehalococcoidales bacterium]|nr:hypothetical protein [Dehalococcoidales bacterium]